MATKVVEFCLIHLIFSYHSLGRIDPGLCKSYNSVGQKALDLVSDFSFRACLQ